MLRIAAVGSGATGAAGTAPAATGVSGKGMRPLDTPDDDSAPDAAASRRARTAKYGCLLSMMVLFALLLVRLPPCSLMRPRDVDGMGVRVWQREILRARAAGVCAGRE